MTGQPWHLSHKADRRALPLADRHYNRRKVGSPQFVSPGRALVLLTLDGGAVWTTSYPFAEYVKHAWAGAMVNSLFRRESGPEASELITAALAATRAVWEPPPLGIVSFVDPSKTRVIKRRGQRIAGWCYFKAGWTHVGYTKAGLWAWQLLPADGPEAIPAHPQVTVIATERPGPGRCSAWVAGQWCGRSEGVRRYLVGERCPAHAPAHAFGYRGGSRGRACWTCTAVRAVLAWATGWLGSARLSAWICTRNRGIRLRISRPMLSMCWPTGLFLTRSTLSTPRRRASMPQP
jgi:hypothetical protein